MAGEIWYARQLLLKFPASSFENLKTVDGTQHPTFQQAGIARGILTCEKECVTCFEEAMFDSTPCQLRSLLIMQTMQGLLLFY